MRFVPRNRRRAPPFCPSPSTVVPYQTGQKSRNKNAKQYDVAAAWSLSVPTSSSGGSPGLENAADCQLEKPQGLGFSISHRPKGARIRWAIDARIVSAFLSSTFFSFRGQGIGASIKRDNKIRRIGRKKDAGGRWRVGRQRASETRGKEFKREGPLVLRKLINYP